MTSTACIDWLPEMIPPSSDWDALIRGAYKIFARDFKESCPRHRGTPVWHNRRLDPGDKYRFEEGFWHLTTKEERGVYDKFTRTYKKDRVPDMRRLERLPWARSTLDNSQKEDVCVFDHVEGSGVTRTYLWLQKENYVVILQKQRSPRGYITWMLITAFYLDYSHSRQGMEQKYKNRVQ